MDTHEEGELLVFCQATADSRCFGESLSGDFNNPVSENSESRLTVRPIGSATIVPLDTSAQKASPSLVWAKSQQGPRTRIVEFGFSLAVNCGYRIIGEGDFYLELTFFNFSFGQTENHPALEDRVT